MEAASFLQHRGSSLFPQKPKRKPTVKIITEHPTVSTTTTELFKDHVQLHTSSPITTAMAASATATAPAVAAPAVAAPAVTAPEVADLAVAAPAPTPVDGQNTQQYSSYVPPNPSLPAVAPSQHNEKGHLASATTYAASASIVSDHHTTTTNVVFPTVSNGSVPSAGALSPPPSSSISDMLTELMSDVDPVNFTSSALIPSSLSPLDKEVTDLGGDNGLINVTLPTGADIQVSNDNLFAGAATTRPSSQDKLAASNSNANVVDQFLEDNKDNNNIDWRWIFLRKC
ncbi:uncharacterized protein LOC122050576 [Zingiber officinale]|uniref:uncharacterized protein LOC122050576 n=1 Tax=Zingiber officinale TaxID=94328 RepID=UPI001C4AFCD9|nr:uncharacterized protein LOC122050576 [Zingiber officinale]